jgi:class 3 adenylate cyclase
MMLGMTYANGYPFIQYIEIGFLTKEVWNQYFLVWHPPVYAFVGLFCIKYLNLGEKKGKWIKRSLLFGIVVLSVLFPILNLWLGTFGALITPFQGLLLLFYLTCLFTSYYFAFRKDKQARFYAIGWTFMIVFVFIFFAVINGFLPFNPFMRNALYFGVACEVWMFSLALGDRMNIIRREKEQMQVENLRLVQEQNAMLERKVEERTLQLKEANEELQQTNEELQTTVEAVEKERLKSDNLLLNILPTQVAQELKNYGFARPQRYELASILFTDFKGFTQIVSNMKPEQVLDNLNYCFTAFDKIIRKNNLEKIKTIGDAYMCVGGVPTADKDNPIRIATAALEMLAFIKEWKAKKIKQGKEAWDLRIGIHTGAVVAGVVGDYKFAYDIWGDAVNLASRMESSGEVSKINISEDTYLHIKDHFYCTYRGEIEAKHKGKIKMYFLDSVLEDNSRKIE